MYLCFWRPPGAAEGNGATTVFIMLAFSHIEAIDGRLIKAYRQLLRGTARRRRGLVSRNQNISHYGHVISKKLFL